MRRRLRIKNKGSILKSRFFWLGVSIVALAELLLYVIVLSSLFQIQEVRVVGNIDVSENKIKGVALERVWGKFLFFPTASIFLIDTQSIRSALLEAIPELEAANIRRKFPNILAISLRERSTVALWCQTNHCVAIDKEGVAFKEVDSSQGFITIHGQDQSLNLKETAVGKNILNAILGFAKEVKRRSLLLRSELSFEIVSENQIHAHTGEGWSVYFTHASDLAWQITKLQTVLENKIPLEKRNKLEYIDVRFGDQAYLKYR